MALRRCHVERSIWQGEGQRQGMTRSTITKLAGLMLLVGFAVALIVLQTPSSTAIGGPFALHDGDGRTITDRDFRGRWMLVYFGYTHCHDACPLALNDMAATLDLLKTDRQKVVPVFITLDPARDTPQIMKEYVAGFDAPITALSGTASEIQAVQSLYKVYAARRPGKDGDYDLDHSSAIYVMGPDGRLRSRLDHTSSAQVIVRRLRQLGL